MESSATTNIINVKDFPKFTSDQKASVFEKAAQAISKSQVVAVPTDTLYGVGCSLWDESAIKNIYSLKNRSYTKPLAICIGSTEVIGHFCKVNHISQNIIDYFLPGPYTLILPLSENIPKFFNPGLKTVGIRVVPNEFLCQLCKHLSTPSKPFALALTSANKSGFPSSISVSEFEDLHSQLGVVFDGGDLDKQRLGSTIIDLSSEEDKSYKILRPGPTVDQARKFLSENEFKEV